MKEVKGITEELKEENQIKWVQMVNNIQSRVQEVINSELIYKI